MIRGYQSLTLIVCVRPGASLALLFALAGCASQKSAESHADYTAEAASTTTRGPVRVTTTVREFAPPQSTNPDPKRAHIASTAPVLVREVVRVTDRAPVVVEARSGTQVQTDAESSSKWHLGFSLWTKILIALGLLALALLAWRFRSGLLGGVLRLLGR